ncbi:MAG: GtrA family protein [Cytophaga sp.]|nr:GtrA family protein [Undibacterium sp.]
MKFLRYALVAGIAYGIDFGGFILLLNIGYSPFWANTLIKVVAAIFGFFSHRYFTYLIKVRNGMGKDAIRYFGLALFYTPTSSILLYGIMLIISNPIYAKVISDISLFILMFWITSRFTFVKAKI